MAVRDDFAAGEVLSATDLNDTFASKLPYSYGTATPSTSDDGFLWYDSNSTPPEVKFWDGAAFQALGGGKILQVVRATDGTNRSTTSTSMVDASISVSITPTKTTSAILLIWHLHVRHPSGGYIHFAITDNSNNYISGSSNNVSFGNATATVNPSNAVIHLAYDTPATTSAITYKGRFRVNTGTGEIFNSTLAIGQLYAIEVGA